MGTIVTRDPQKSVLYREQFEVTSPVGDEKLPSDALRSVVNELWNRRVGDEFQTPEIKEGRENNVYLPDFHVIMLSDRRVTMLLHELAHASVAAIGKTLFTEAHGPLFCHEFGRFWAEYAATDFETWRSRWKSRGIKVLRSRPELEKYKWALPEKRNVAVRPARDAIRSKLEVQRVFADIDLHPLT